MSLTASEAAPVGAQAHVGHAFAESDWGASVVGVSPEALAQAARVLRARPQPRLTQVGVAARGGLRKQTVSDIERAQANPSLKTLNALARGLGVTVSHLLAEAERQDIRRSCASYRSTDITLQPSHLPTTGK